MSYFQRERKWQLNWQSDQTAVKYTTEEAEALAGIQQDLIGYAETQYAHWVVDGGVEEEWDAYLEQLNKMQLETYIELQMQAYNAYMENMN